MENDSGVKQSLNEYLSPLSICGKIRYTTKLIRRGQGKALHFSWAKVERLHGGGGDKI